MNSVNLIGRLTKDIEVNTAGSVKVAKFTLAVPRSFKNKAGEYDSDFIQCAAFDKKADFMYQYFKKGQMLGITGEIRTRKWDQDGTTRYATEVNVNDITFTESKKDGSQRPSTATPTTASISDILPDIETVSIDIDYEELPF